MFLKKLVKLRRKIQDKNKSNIRLWAILALVPVAVVVLVYIIGSTSFFGTAYRYDDTSAYSKSDDEEDVKEITNELPPRRNIDTIFQNAVEDSSTAISDAEATITETPTKTTVEPNNNR